MHCRLLLPDVFPPPPVHVALPDGLSRLLQRGEETRNAAQTPEDWLCRAFGVARQQDNPIAPFSLLADDGAPGDAYWLRADPVTVYLMRNQIVLFATDARALTEAEAAEFIAALNLHFSPEGLQFSAPQPHRWYVRLPTAPALDTRSLAEVHGHGIQHYLPSGEDSARWRRLLNEAQILLHQHPRNVAREARGQPPINSIWPWGGGVLPADAVVSPCASLRANDPLARGLAIAAGIPAAPLPARLPEQEAGDSALFVLEPPNGTQTWQERLAALDENWFSPALRALRRGKISRLTLIACGDGECREVTLGRFDLWKIWRRGKRDGFAAYFAPHPHHAKTT